MFSNYDLTTMTRIGFHDISFSPAIGLTYSVIVARFGGKWIFVRHVNRETWEIPGGHIEPGESPDDAASRELMEETGAGKFEIVCVAVYSVEKEGNVGFGRLYFAEVSTLAEISDVSEIAEIKLKDSLPEDLTYPDIQPHLFNRIMEYLKNNQKFVSK